MDLQTLLRPQSVAVIGVSRNRGKLGYDLFSNICQSYKGKIFGFNPHGGKVAGHKLYRQLTDCAVVPDVALVLVPAVLVPEVVLQAARLGWKRFVILSAGFSESGARGQKLEHKLQQIQQQHSLQIIGPNCLGYLNAALGLNATFAQYQIPTTEGEVALISQSGAMAVALLDKAAQTSINLRYMVSVGNRINIGENELLAYMAHDPKVKVIGLYIESLQHPREFFRLCARITKHTPIVLLKGGTTSAGAVAARSHTGSLAQPETIISAGCQQAGVIKVDSIRQFFMALQSLRYGPTSFPSGSLMLITNAGGPAIVAADRAQRNTLQLETLRPVEKKKLQKILPAGAFVHNPVDLLGDATLQRFTRTITALQRQNRILVLMITPQTMTPVDELTQWLLQKKSLRSSLIIVYLGGEKMKVSVRTLHKEGFAVFAYPDEAVDYLGRLYQASGPRSGISATKNILQPASKEVQNLNPKESEVILKRAGLPILSGKLLTRSQELRSITAYPVAMKLVAQSIIHKAAAGAVRLDVGNQAEAEQIWRELHTQYHGSVNEIRGVYVQPMAKKGLELFIGARRDPQFGIYITFGLGGNQVELVADVQGGLAPLNEKYIIHWLKHLKMYQQLPAAALQRYIEIIKKVDNFMFTNAKVQELDLNPVIVYNDSLSIVDCRIVCTK